MANWLTAVGFWEQQMLRRILNSWRALGGQKLLTALAHWESSQSGLGPAFRWWRRVVLHLRDAGHVAQQHRQQHACRAAFQASHFVGQLHVSADNVTHMHSMCAEHNSACHFLVQYSCQPWAPKNQVWFKSSQHPQPPSWCLSGAKACSTF